MKMQNFLVRVPRYMMALITVISLMCSLNYGASAQSGVRTITGVVKDSRGEVIPGASVIVVVEKDQPIRGTATNQNGEFSLSVSQYDKAFEVSYVGLETQQIAITSANSYIIQMEEDAQQLKDVVVTGVFERKANSYTGAVTTVTAEDLQLVGNTNVLQSLSVIDPSFMVVENLSAGSNPNALPEIQMRGQSGFDNNEPLFILDGFETTLTAIMDLDMNMVQSVTLLKDATAKAIYGAKAANGVVVVETKRPEKGKLRVSYTGSVDVETPDLSSYNLTNAEEKLQAEKLAGFYDSENAMTQISLDQTYTNMLQKIEAGVNTDWMAQPLRTGVGQKHSVYLDGGDGATTYQANLAYNQVNGVMDESFRKTINGSLSIVYRTDKFMFRNKLSVDDNRTQESPYGTFAQYTLMNPYNELEDENGQMPKMYTGIVTQYNPLHNGTIGAYDKTNYTYVTNNTYLEYRPIEALRITAQFGVTVKNSGADNFKPAAHTDFMSYTGENLYRAGSYYDMNRKDNSWTAQFGVQYSLTKDKHLFFVNGQVNANQTKYTYSTMNAEGFPNNNLSHVSSAVQYAENTTPGGGEGIQRDFGFIASANYSFDEKYLFDANLRLTGSSQFGADNRWGLFWSVGAGWNIHRESFLKESTWLDRLKVRFSTGYTGSQGFNTYDAIATLNYNMNAQYNGMLGSYVTRLANPSLQWQKKYDTNVGVDFGFLNNIITGRFDWYKATTKGLTTSITTPGSTGFVSYVDNLGESENKGYEAYLNIRLWQQPRSRSFVSVYSSLASNTNTLKKIAHSLKQQNDMSDASMNSTKNVNLATRYEEGQSLNTIWAVQSLGIDPQTGKELYVRKDGSLTYEWNAADQVACGIDLPKVSGNFGLNAECHGAGINMTFTYRTGGQMYNSTLVSKVENANVRYNVDKRVLTDRWSKPGDEVRFKSIADQSATQPTSRFVEDYTLVNFAALSVYYDFRECNFVKNSFLQKLKATFYVNDLATWSSVKVERGTAYPYAHTYSFSLSATF